MKIFVQKFSYVLPFVYTLAFQSRNRKEPSVADPDLETYGFNPLHLDQGYLVS
jgi:hypothetical protein